MIWIPVVFFCLINGECMFLQGNGAYTRQGCVEQLVAIGTTLQSDERVSAFDTTCITITPT
jgi:hypothetical protein